VRLDIENLTAEELEALNYSNDHFSLEEIADNVERCRDAVEAFVHETIDTMHVDCDTGEEDFSPDLKELLGILQNVRDELDEIAIWGVGSMNERIEAANKEIKRKA
jgi:hypothetical protein